MEIGTLIQRIRKGKSLTQQQVANAMMITRPYLAKIENNHHQIS
ncbi:MAG: helix-turn-helix domain-containing protein, partial [Candidatus Kurthia intestinigallinarum]